MSEYKAPTDKELEETFRCDDQGYRMHAMAAVFRSTAKFVRDNVHEPYEKEEALLQLECAWDWAKGGILTDLRKRQPTRPSDD